MPEASGASAASSASVPSPASSVSAGDAGATAPSSLSAAHGAQGPGTDPGTLVVCSGRCGSTLVADLLAEHDSTVSLLEFFGPQFTTGPVQDVLTGGQFWDLVTEAWPSLNTVLRLGRVPKEVRYDLSGHETPPELGSLLGFTLPAISSTPDKLLAELAALVPDFPTQDVGAHYRQLFALLAGYAGKPRWVEKSAVSSLYVTELLEMFPGARIVYLTRDVLDVALSMTNHPMFLTVDMSTAFRQRCGFDPFSNAARPEGVQVPPDLEHMLPENLTAEALDERAGTETSVLNLLGFQAMMARRVDDALDDLPSDRAMRLVYEDLVTEPERELLRLAHFLGLDGAEEWAARSATRVVSPKSRSDELDEETRTRYRSYYKNMYQVASLMG